MDNHTYITLLSPGHPDQTILFREATLKQIIQWIRQAPDVYNYNRRKSIAYHKLVNSKLWHEFYTAMQEVRSPKEQNDFMRVMERKPTLDKKHI